MSKTQSKFGVTVKENVVIPNVYLSNTSQDFSDVAGTYKLNFGEGGVSISNQSTGLLTTDIANDAFVSAVRATKWLITYSGYVKTSAGATETLVAGIYKNGVVHAPSLTSVTFSNNEYFYPISKTIILDVATTNTVDLRFTKEDEAVTVVNFTLTLTQLG